jgi:hypothetical protein
MTYDKYASSSNLFVLSSDAVVAYKGPWRDAINKSEVKRSRVTYRPKIRQKRMLSVSLDYNMVRKVVCVV